jgi:SNF2 family DNA or RNA helicase
MCGILADEMGLGKTLQSLAFQIKIDGRTLVVCPSSLVINWQREADRIHRASGRRHPRGRSNQQLQGRQRIAPWITSYALLRRDWSYTGLSNSAP